MNDIYLVTTYIQGLFKEARGFELYEDAIHYIMNEHGFTEYKIYRVNTRIKAVTEL